MKLQNELVRLDFSLDAKQQGQAWVITKLCNNSRLWKHRTASSSLMPWAWTTGLLLDFLRLFSTLGSSSLSCFCSSFTSLRLGIASHSWKISLQILSFSCSFSFSEYCLCFSFFHFFFCNLLIFFYNTISYRIARCPDPYLAVVKIIRRQLALLGVVM